MIITYNSFLRTSALIITGIGLRFMVFPPMASMQALMGSISQQYQTSHTMAYGRIAQKQAFYTPSKPDFLEDIIRDIDDSEIKFLMGSPEEESLEAQVALYQDNPELAALVPQDNSIEGKNFWFDRYNYYSELYEPKNHQTMMEEFESFQDATPEQHALYLQMLADLEIPYRKPLKTFSKEHSKKENSFAFTYNDQIAICGDLPFEQFRTTLYHEGQHLKHHDPVKLLIVRTILYNTPAYSDEHIQQIMDDYLKFIEHRADYTTYHNHINCYTCSFLKADFIKNNTTPKRVELGYISSEELHAIGKEQEKNNMLCAHHQHELQQAQSA
jgi:hypothetical protein